MPNAREFDDEELRIAGLRSVDAVDDALAREDAEAARGFVRRLRREARSMKGNYDAWTDALLRWVAARDAGLAEGWRATLAEAGTPVATEASDAAHRARWDALAREAEDALARGDAAGARSAARTLHDDALAEHDRGMHRVNRLLSLLARRFGDDPLEEAYLEAMGVDLLGTASFRERAEALLHFTRVHLQPFAVEEDDEKLVFRCPGCPSGGRLLREGAYDGDDAAHEVVGPRWLTWGRERLPVYCAHEPVMERSSAQRNGAPLFCVEPSSALGREPCVTYLFKDAARIPERFYTRLGLEKPR